MNDIEKQLCINFPESYKWFLGKYGFGGIFGVEILGCGKGGVPSVIRETERYRKLGLPLDYVVISSSDEWVYCLDLKNGDKHDCKIISWDRNIGFRKIEAESFFQFILEEFKDGKDSWD
ncbi:SMI1/KNR4 family protein [Clostridium saccharobutylicum]|uniref:SMI1/KNR4 family protein n=1 Tax=Clostridium saccharobutylicum TaxID=169679 RepID=UPI00156F0C51